MDWLPQPFSALSGPEFLLVYGAFAVAVIIVSRLQVTAADQSLASPLPPVSPERDPYEIAYLRGGGNELLRFTIFDAMRRNVLHVVPPTKGEKAQRIERSVEKVATGSTIFDNVVNWYAVPHTTEELFASPMPKGVEAWGAKEFGPSLEAEGLLTGAPVRSAATRVRLYGAAALVIFAGLRLLEAFSRHHRNVGFLLLMLFVSLVLLLGITRVPRLSRRGRAYLQRLQAALRPAGVPGPFAAGGAGAAGAALLPIFVAATGLQALAGTEFAPINKLFPARVSSGGDSGGCGSSGGGSSSCGGGGGCGGGGCGG